MTDLQRTYEIAVIMREDICRGLSRSTVEANTPWHVTIKKLQQEAKRQQEEMR